MNKATLKQESKGFTNKATVYLLKAVEHLGLKVKGLFLDRKNRKVHLVSIPHEQLNGKVVYPYPDLVNPEYFVVEEDEDIIDADLEAFWNGEFSKMYKTNPHEIGTKAYAVIEKTEKRRQVVRREFGLPDNFDFGDAELDSQPIEIDEFIFK